MPSADIGGARSELGRLPGGPQGIVRDAEAAFRHQGASEGKVTNRAVSPASSLQPVAFKSETLEQTGQTYAVPHFCLTKNIQVSSSLLFQAMTSL